MAQSYKSLKEDFVSNLSGGGVLEINYVTAIAPSAYFLWSVLQSRFGFFSTYGALEYLSDFLLNVVCLLSAVTIYSQTPLILNALLLLPAVTIYLLCQPERASKHPSKPASAKEEEKEKLDALPVRPFITAYRGGMMIITCIAILAVDFRIFPRRFAKVETWGTSLMDMGVGSFVFSSGLVAARPVLQAQISGKRSSLSSLLLASPRNSIPLILLGFIRLYSVKGLDYAEHVTEYGVHWNFFFTLALIPPFASLLQPLVSKLHPFALVAVLSGSYEAILLATDLKAYILTAARTDLLSQNREGVFSFIGYLSIFLIGQGLGLQILPRNLSGSSSGYLRSPKRRIFVHLIGNSLLWVSVFSIGTAYRYGLGLQVSRRLANFPYVSWVAAFNCSQLFAFYLLEQVCFPGILTAKNRSAEKKECDRATSKVLRACNRNGLAIFLFANLLTGLVNLTVNTLTMDRIGSLAILLAYCGALTGVAVFLDTWNISIKL